MGAPTHLIIYSINKTTMKFTLKGIRDKLSATQKSHRRNSQILQKVEHDRQTKKSWAKNNPIRKAAQDPKNKYRSTRTPEERSKFHRGVYINGQEMRPEHLEFKASLSPEMGKQISRDQSWKEQGSYITQLVSRKIGGSHLKGIANKIKKSPTTGNMGMVLEKQNPGYSDKYLVQQQRTHKQMMRDRVKGNKGSMGSSWNVVKK